MDELRVRFEPKQNLHGYDRPWVGGAGKNICKPIDTWRNGWVIGTELYFQDETYLEKQSPTIPVTPGQAYTFSYALTGTPSSKYWAMVIFVGSDEFTYIGKVETNKTDTKEDLTVTIPENASYVRCVVRTYGMIDYVQFESGDTATAYAPYENICPIEGWDGVTVTVSNGSGSNTEIPIGFSTTIYGGYIDLVKGELVQEWELLNLSEQTFSTSSNAAMLYYDGEYVYPDYEEIPEAVAEKYTGISADGLLKEYNFMMNRNVITFYYDGTNLPSGNIALKLATPIHHSLTPQQIQLLKNMNTIYSNTNSTLDMYYTEYHQETPNLMMLRQDILANQPHLEKVSDGLVSFDTDMTAKLKECKVYFSPVQEGSGDPSPDNVRPISGWNGVTVRHSKSEYYRKLPDEYQQVEYIESTGTQWIDTGIIGKPNLSYSAAISYNTDNNFSSSGMLGSRENAAGGRFYIFSIYQNYWHLGIDSGDWKSRAVSPNRKYEIFFRGTSDSCVLEVDGEQILTVNASFETTYPMFLFACNNYGTAARHSSAKLYFIRMIQNNILVRDFVPCHRKSDHKPGLYDLVSGEFLVNQGTGDDFLMGEEIYGEEVEIEFPAVGKNLFDSQNVNEVSGYTVSGISIAKSQSDKTIYIKCKPNTTYTVSKSIGGVLAAFYTIDEPKVDIDVYGYKRDTAQKTVTITTGEDAKYLCAWCYDKTKEANKDLLPQDIYDVLQIEEGSTATEYESYSNTIYGGYVDLVKGEVVEEWHQMVIDETSIIGILPWHGIKTDSTTGVEYASALFLRKSTDPKGYNIKNNLCDKLPYNINPQIYSAYFYDGDYYGPCISLPTALIGTNQESLKQYLNNNPFTFCYKLRASIHHPIPLSILRTLKGTNNIWSNTNDNIEVEYWTHK